MKVKEISSTMLIILGVIGLIVGLFGIFGSNLTKQNPWIFAILGLIFFISGISLLKSVNH